MTFQVEILRSAQKALRKIDSSDRDRLILAIHGLSGDPRPTGCTKLAGRPAWRIRVGVYRVIYEIHDSRLRVLVVAISHRRDVYRT